jgi:hypothetical protein
MTLFLPLFLFWQPIEPVEYRISLPLREWEQVDDSLLDTI